MAPSRGLPSINSSHHHKSESHIHDEVAVDQQSRSALAAARRNFSYLLDPTKSSSTDRPGRLRTRALLRTVRFFSTFIFWRLVRWAKYAAVGALVAAVSATAVGGFVTGIGWIAAPPTIGASVLMYGVWGVGKFAARRLHRKWKVTGEDTGEAQRELHEDRGLKATGQYGDEMGPQAVPW